jgi:hypothetical protein
MTSFDDVARSYAALPGDRCSWCGTPYHDIYRRGLCRHCYEIELDKHRARKRVQERWRTGDGMPWKALDLDLRAACHVAGMMEEIERSEGDLVEFERQADHSGMKIEELLEYISRKLLHKNLYNNCATMLASLFSADQRKALIHLLSEVVDEHQRRNLRKTVRRLTAERNQRPPRWLLLALANEPAKMASVQVQPL